MASPLNFPNAARPRRHGCAGCLAQSTLILLAGGALLYAMLVLLAPWNFYFGGHFHFIPGWTGSGWIHSAVSGGDYFLWVYFEPTIPGYRKSPLKGTAYLCSPKGGKYRLHFGGLMPRQHGNDLRGVPIHLYLYNWPLLATFTGSRRPSFDLYGTFGDARMIVDDHGSLARAFGPDGTLFGQNDRNRPWNQPSSQVTLKEDSSWRFHGCPAAPK